MCGKRELYTFTILYSTLCISAATLLPFCILYYAFPQQRSLIFIESVRCLYPPHCISVLFTVTTLYFCAVYIHHTISVVYIHNTVFLCSLHSPHCISVLFAFTVGTLWEMYGKRLVQLDNFIFNAGC